MVTNMHPSPREFDVNEVITEKYILGLFQKNYLMQGSRYLFSELQ
jgi:hypothetical protein